MTVLGGRGRAVRTTALTALAVLATGAVLVGCAADVADPDGAATTAAAAATDGDATAAATEDQAPSETVEVSSLDGGECPGDTVDAEFPDVVGASFTPVQGETGAFEVAVTLCSLYDSAERYADAWRVTTPDGQVLGTRELLHDHAGEQPFTRTLTGTLTVPDGVATVVVEARDQANGWGGTTLVVDLGDA